MPRLLIVDDDAVDRELARRCLATLDEIEIFESADGGHALDEIAACSPDVVLSDLRMPAVDGLELVRQTRERFPLIPVILMTSRGSEQVAVEALTAGAASYVPKADLVELLAETVRQVLAVAAARRERAEVLRYFRRGESRFELANDPEIISPLVAYLEDNLERIGFGDDRIRSQISTSLMEALSNAIVHGNLEVSSKLRRNGTEPYHQLIRERRQAEPWAGRRVHLLVDESPERVHYLIRDEGPGFDVSSLPDPTRPENMLRAEGRGLFLIHAFMDEVRYNSTGNEVLLTKRVR